MLFVVEIGEEQVQCLGVLDAAGLDMRPLRHGNTAWDGVEGDQVLGALLVAAQGEGNADAVGQQVGFAPVLQQLFFRGVDQPTNEFLIIQAAFVASITHLVVKHACHAKLLVVTSDGEPVRPVSARGSRLIGDS